MRIIHACHLVSSSFVVATLLLALTGCAANDRRADETFLKQVEKDPFPSASSKGLAAK
jgi:hypothetical protein